MLMRCSPKSPKLRAAGRSKRFEIAAKSFTSRKYLNSLAPLSTNSFAVSYLAQSRGLERSKGSQE